MFVFLNLDLHIVLVVNSLKTKKEWKNKKPPGDSKYICQKELDKTCFQHYMTYGYFKGLNIRTADDKVLPEKSI